MLPEPNDLVLVAFLPSPRDLEIARVLGWYRIPLVSAPRVVALDYIAFYQPASFGDSHKWCIEYFAQVKGHELVTREQLFKEAAGTPRAGEEYFKLAIGPLQTLPRPLPARDWKRLTFLYTTGERLLSAESVDDLSVHDQERDVLFRSLRDRAKLSEYKTDKEPEFPFTPDLLAYLAFSSASELLTRGNFESEEA